MDKFLLLLLGLGAIYAWNQRRPFRPPLRPPIPPVVPPVIPPVTPPEGPYPEPPAEPEPIPPEVTEPLNLTYDADGVLWGTEGYPLVLDSSNPSQEARASIDAVNNYLRTKCVKIRLEIMNFSTDGKTFSPDICMPSYAQCIEKYNMDESVRIFQENGWSMFPMLTHDKNKPTVTDEDIANYVNFVDWFVSRYKDSANINYLELINAPSLNWKGTSEQLLELQNSVYERIKSKYHSIMIGTQGFEYFLDNVQESKGLPQVEYFLSHNAKFDFWAFHGYPATSSIAQRIYYPPTKTGLNNKYIGIPGILEIRKKLNANGWQDRKIIDTEHVGLIRIGQSITDEDDKLDTAYMVQELLLKRTLEVLSGILPLKIGPRSNIGDQAWANLHSDGSVTWTVNAVGLLWSKLNKYKYDGRISGEFDNESQVWIEKFVSDNGELYIFFKPFVGETCALDYQILNCNLDLGAMPSLVTLTDVYGNVINLTPNQVLTLEAENSPKFLEVSY